MSLKDNPCIIKPALIDLNPVDKCRGSCKCLVIKSIWPKVFVPKEAKNINVKAFDVITNKNEAKKMTKHISCDCKCILNSTTCDSNQKWNNETCQCEC